MPKLTFKIIIALITFTLLFGCIATPQKMVEANGIVKDYMLAHPEAKVTVAPYISDVKTNAFWTKNCVNPINFDRNYYEALVSDSNLTLRALFEKSQMLLVCGIIEDTATKIIVQTDKPALPKTCANIGGKQCDLNQKCAGNWITSATDTNRCCDNLCKAALVSGDTDENITPNRGLCEGIIITDCNLTQKCTSIAMDRNVECGCNKCESRVCADYGGLICPTDTNCYGDLNVMPDTQSCCLGVCYKIEVTVTDTNDTNTN